MMDEKFKRAINLFNTGKYFESHDVLEELWLETEDEYRDLYQGIIQCAVAFYLIQEKRYEGASKTFKRAVRNLDKYKPIANNINVDKLLINCTEFFKNKDYFDSASASLSFPHIEYSD